MSVELTEYSREDVQGTDELLAVQRIACELLAHLNSPGAQALLAEANLPRSSSALVQASFIDFAHELGFVDESKGLFLNYPTSALRPDYFLPLGDSGILLEVERGKTTINNMDLLDFWKCHLCEQAHYLFLMVPKELRQNETMTPRREYGFVVKRLQSFFVSCNYTNVRGLFVFGY
jgi:hypothetical protein